MRAGNYARTRRRVKLGGFDACREPENASSPFAASTLASAVGWLDRHSLEELADMADAVWPT